jgi:SseB protein N-terminal domain
MRLSWREIGLNSFAAAAVQGARLPPGARSASRAAAVTHRDHSYSDGVPDLTGGDQRYRDDRGAADPAVAAALAAFAGGSGSEHAVLTALAGGRLLVPVVAVAADQVPRSGEAASSGLLTGRKTSEMAMPTVVGRDGRRALPAFTSQASLLQWQPAGRPVPVPAVSVWQSAVQESCAVVIDIAGPVPVAVEGARLAALAGGAPVPPLHQDPDVWQLAAAIAAEHAPGIRVKLSAAGDGLDLAVELAPPADVAGQVPGEVANRIGEALSVSLADRARRGIAVTTRGRAATS